MFEFRLVYQGLLKGRESTTEDKQEIRRYLHEQLVNLWMIRYPLKHMIKSAGGEISKVPTDYRLGDKKILPIATRENCLVCGIDITLLRKGNPSVWEGAGEGGDIDNRIRTLVDSLRIPKSNEDCSGPENPLCCVMEDDSLISELRVLSDMLLATPEQVIKSPKISQYTGEPTMKEIHALALIHVSMKATRAVPGNMEFV